MSEIMTNYPVTQEGVDNASILESDLLTKEMREAEKSYLSSRVIILRARVDQLEALLAEHDIPLPEASSPELKSVEEAPRTVPPAKKTAARRKS